MQFYIFFPAQRIMGGDQNTEKQDCRSEFYSHFFSFKCFKVVKATKQNAPGHGQSEGMMNNC